MARRRNVAGLVCAAALGACGIAPEGGGITTGSILPSLPALPSAGSLAASLAQPTGPRAPQRISANLYRVDAGDQRLADQIQRENYTLLRAAESTRHVGATHFIVVNAPQGAAPHDVRNPDRGQTTALIRVLELEPGSEPPMGAISADEIIHFFGPSFGRTTAPPGRPPS